MLAQLKAYKWTILIVIISGLLLFSGFQYHRADKLATKNVELSDKVTKLEGSVKTIKESVESAQANLEKLRQENEKVSKQTEELRERLAALPGTPKAPPIPKTPEGNVDTAKLEIQVNSFSDDIFKRLEGASRGKIDE